MDNEFGYQTTAPNNPEPAYTPPLQQPAPSSRIHFKALAIAGLLYSLAIFVMAPMGTMLITEALRLLALGVLLSTGGWGAVLVGLWFMFAGPYIVAFLNIILSGSISALILTPFLRRYTDSDYSKKAIAGYTLPLAATLLFVLTKSRELVQNTAVGFKYLFWITLFIALTVLATLLLALSFKIMASMKNRPKQQRYAMAIPLLLITIVIGSLSAVENANYALQQLADDWDAREEAYSAEVKQEDARRLEKLTIFLPEYHHDKFALDRAYFNRVGDVRGDGYTAERDIYIMEYKSSRQRYQVQQYAAQADDPPCVSPESQKIYHRTTSQPDCQEIGVSTVGCSVFTQVDPKTTSRFNHSPAFCRLGNTVIKIAPMPEVVFSGDTGTELDMQHEDFMAIYNSLVPSDDQTIKSTVRCLINDKNRCHTPVFTD